jgi:phage terminase small subunit
MADARKKTFKFDEVEAELNDRQKLFCHKYIEHKFVGATAAIEAGYGKKNAGNQAIRLLDNVEIQKYIKAIKSDLGLRLGITRERIAGELAKIAFYDPRKLYDDDGDLIKFTNLDDDTAGAINSVEVCVDRMQQTTTRRVKVSDKNRALESLNRMLGYDAPIKIAETDSAGNDVVMLPKKDFE